MWTTEENSRRNHDDSKATFNYIKFIFFSQTSILLGYKNTADEVRAREEKKHCTAESDTACAIYDLDKYYHIDKY